MVDKRLTPTPKPKNNEADGAVTLRVAPPNVKVGVPKVDVKVDSPQLNMDSTAFAEALESLAIAINQLGQMQAQIAQQIAETNRQLTVLAGQQPNIKVEAPKVTLPARPRSFRVEVEDEDGETTYMRIAAESPN